ncbi:hypothetical protein WJX73_009775 [Symbiochloris irregularis]|uniref:Uncharacterized protein n=1 Tax=Symbiochloris irregularis TaxID=706552 RepID=A0AAW1NTA0_9CHLO
MNVKLAALVGANWRTSRSTAFALEFLGVNFAASAESEQPSTAGFNAEPASEEFPLRRNSTVPACTRAQSVSLPLCSARGQLTVVQSQQG